mmetsp:Transcript_20251/g.64656  ORF Transcript_20251/g.64656 Transcript_20251/m.64656 type:complete len:202 (+) Transcript_20251:893-1498(+)
MVRVALVGAAGCWVDHPCFGVGGHWSPGASIWCRRRCCCGRSAGATAPTRGCVRRLAGRGSTLSLSLAPGRAVWIAWPANAPHQDGRVLTCRSKELAIATELHCPYWLFVMLKHLNHSEVDKLLPRLLVHLHLHPAVIDVLLLATLLPERQEPTHAAHLAGCTLACCSDTSRLFCGLLGCALFLGRIDKRVERGVRVGVVG